MIKNKSNLKTPESRKQAFDKMIYTKNFNNKIVLIGYGAIGRALVPLLFKLIKFNPTNLSIIDMNPSAQQYINPTRNLNINIINVKLDKNNIKVELIDKLKLGQDDLIIDASYNINTNFMHKLCMNYGISYINSSVELWKDDNNLKPIDYTFYSRIKSIEDAEKENTIKKNNFLISMGCNPGNVNIWTLYALNHINKKTKQINFNNYAELANKLGLQVIHISEKDTQISSINKKDNEYVNTWASNAISWYDEAFSQIEIGWGTHENKLPENINQEISNEYQYIIDNVGSDNFAISYTPISKEISGMLIRHEECFTICRKLTLRNDDNNIIYKPSSYYVYKTCDHALASTEEVKNKEGVYQSDTRLMTYDITEGNDEIGCTLFFDSGDIYWIGSLLDINEARMIYDNEHNNIINATILQVVAGYIGGIFYLIESIEKKIYRGLMTPEDLPIEKIIHWTRPLLGPFIIAKVTDWKIKSKDPKNKWQFSDFLVL